MRVNYRGHTIEVTREQALGGWMSLYTTIIRESDGFICAEFFGMEDHTPIREQISYMKRRIDAEMLEDDPWGETELYELADTLRD